MIHTLNSPGSSHVEDTGSRSSTGQASPAANGGSSSPPSPTAPKPSPWPTARRLTSGELAVARLLIHRGIYQNMVNHGFMPADFWVFDAIEASARRLLTSNPHRS